MEGGERPCAETHTPLGWSSGSPCDGTGPRTCSVAGSSDGRSKGLAEIEKARREAVSQARENEKRRERKESEGKRGERREGEGIDERGRREGENKMF